MADLGIAHVRHSIYANEGGIAGGAAMTIHYMKEENNMNVNANNPYYVPQYATWAGGKARNTGGLNQQEILERKLKLEVGARMREAMPHGSPGKSAEAVNNLRVDIIRELMSEKEEGSLAFNILQRMLEGIRN